MELKVTPLSFCVHEAKDNAVFGASAIHIVVCDDAAGPYVKIRQLEPLEGGGSSEITLTLEEISLVMATAKKLIRLNEEVNV